MTNAQLRAREFVMHHTLVWYGPGDELVPDEFIHYDAVACGTLVREAEAAIKAAIEDERLIETDGERDLIQNSIPPSPLNRVNGMVDALTETVWFHSHAHKDGSLTIVPGHFDDCQSRWCQRVKLDERGRQR